MNATLRRSVFNRIVAVGALIAADLFIGGTASAQTQQQIDWCENKGDAFSLDLQINGCTATIQSGRWSGQDLVRAYYHRSIAYRIKGQYDRAIADYDSVLRLDPKNAAIFISRGNTYRAMGESDHAIADYGEAIRLDPQYANAFYNRGVTYANKGQYDRAIADFDEAIRLDPKNAAVFIKNRAEAVAKKNQ